jgi:hypothetical protein
MPIDSAITAWVRVLPEFMLRIIFKQITPELKIRAKNPEEVGVRSLEVQRGNFTNRYVP